MTSRIGIDVAASNRASAVFNKISKDGQKSFKQISAGADIARRAMYMMTAGAVAMAAKTVASLAVVAAQAGDTRQAFRRLAAGFGQDADEIIEALRNASRNTVPEFDLIAKASQAMRLGVARDVEEFEKLMKIATMRGKEFGYTTSQAWGFMVTGIGRASPRILDNIGYIIEAERVNQAYALSIHKNVDALTLEERQWAVRNKIIDESTDALKAWTEAEGSAADKAAALDAKIADLKITMGKGLGGTLVTIIDLLEKAIDANTKFIAIAVFASVKIVYMIENMGRAITDWEKVQAEAMEAAKKAFIDAAIFVGQWEQEVTEELDIVALRNAQVAKEMTADWAVFEARSKTYFEGVAEAGHTYLSEMSSIEKDLSKTIQEAKKRHNRSMIALSRWEARSRIQIAKNLANALAAADRNANTARIDAEKSFATSMTELFENQARARLEYEKQLTGNIFEAAGRRDAITIRRLQRQAGRDKSRMRREQSAAKRSLKRQQTDRFAAIEQQRRREVEAAHRAHTEEMASLEDQRRERIRELREALRQEIDDAREAAEQKGRDAWDAHQFQLAELSDAYRQVETTTWRHLAVVSAAWDNYWDEMTKMLAAWKRKYAAAGVTAPPSVPDWVPPGFQMGGRVPGPPGARVPITAHGGEMVVPRGGELRLLIELQGGVDVSGSSLGTSEEFAAAIMQGLALAIFRITGQRV